MPASPVSARVRRMLALLPYLREQGRRSLRELATLSNTDVETVAADLTTLSMCGGGDDGPSDLLAVLVDHGEAVVFGELPALEDPVRLTGPEAKALVAALDACGVGPDSDLVRRLSRISREDAAADRLGNELRAPEGPDDAVRTHAVLAACACAHRVARITYAPLGATEHTERTVHPWRLFHSRGAWYLQAWVAEGGEHGEGARTLRLDRIGSVTATTSSFEPPVKIPAVIDATPDMAPLPRAEVVFAHDAPSIDERSWPGAAFDRREDGTVVAHVPYAGTEWIARKVAARLGDAVVTGPAEVREAVERIARDEAARAATRG